MRAGDPLLRRKGQALAEGFGLLALTLFLLFALSGCKAPGADGPTILSLYMVLGSDTPVIHCWHDASTGDYYAFLPAHASDKGRLYWAEKDVSLRYAGKDLVPGDTLSLSGQDSPPSISVYRGASSLSDLRLHVMTGAQLPALYITLDSGTLEGVHGNKNFKTKASMRLVDMDGTLAYAGKVATFKGRGNYTWEAAKKPYNITLEAAAGFLGMGATSKWALLANYYDEGYVRNKIVYDMARAAGLAASPESAFVDLYIDGDYCGLYQLSQRITLGDNRVEIADLEAATSTANGGVKLSALPPFAEGQTGQDAKGYAVPRNPQDISGGYLLEMEQIPGRYEESASGFITQAGQPVAIAAPEAASREQVAYIQALVQAMEEALLSPTGIHPETGTHYTDYLDITSWVTRYLIEEISLNYDMGLSSQYFYKAEDAQSTLLYAGPVWDYDMSLGNGDLSIAYPNILRGPHELVTNPGAEVPLYLYWYAPLLAQEDFTEALRSTFAHTFLPVLESLLESGLDAIYTQIAPSAAMDETRWRDAPKNAGSLHFDTLDEHKAFLKNFIAARTAFLQSLWLDGEDYHTLTLYPYSVSSHNLHLYIKEGLPAASLPHLSRQGYVFEGWVHENSGLPFQGDIPLTEDATLVPLWRIEE